MNDNPSTDLDQDLENRKADALKLRGEIAELIYKENIDSMAAAARIAESHGMTFEEMTRQLNLLDLTGSTREEIKKGGREVDSKPAVPKPAVPKPDVNPKASQKPEETGSAKERKERGQKMVRDYEKKLSILINNTVKNPSKDLAKEIAALRDKIYVVDTRKPLGGGYGGIQNEEMKLIFREDDPDFYDTTAESINLGADEILVLILRKTGQIRGSGRLPILALCEKPSWWDIVNK